MIFPLIAPVWGEYYRIGACPYLLGITVFCPCKGRRVQPHNELCAPYRGKVCVKHKRRGEPLRYTMSSLRDLLVAKVSPDTNKKEYVWMKAKILSTCFFTVTKICVIGKNQLLLQKISFCKAKTVQRRSRVAGIA